MLKTITPAEMKRVETRVMSETSITGEALMLRAASHVTECVRRHCAGRRGVVLCLCATGNNGGDGLAAMRLLAQADADFEGECWILEGPLSPDAQRELSRLMSEAPQVAVRRVKEKEEPNAPENVICAIDALFGTGLSRPLAGAALTLCRLLNALFADGTPVISVDIPSGLNGETGRRMGETVRATETVTFHRPKTGLYLGDGPDVTGRITVADIGLGAPPAAELDDAEGFSVLERHDLGALLPPRRRVSHKGSYGRVLLWAGSRGMAGAAAISATAALRAGAGLVTVSCPENVTDIIQTLCPCATCVPLNMENEEEAWTTLEGALGRADALGAGCGLGQGEVTAALFERLLGWLSVHPLPAVLDADALNLLARRPAYLTDDATRILTPHPGEAARLMGISASEAGADAVCAAKKLRKRYGASIVLKGAVSVLASARGVALNPFGTPAMSKGGSGDALCGVLTALLAGRAAGAYQMDDLKLMQTACAMHGLAGEEAERRFGERGVLATDLCACLGLDFSCENSNEAERFIGGEGACGEEKRDASAPCFVEAREKENASSPLGRSVTVTVEHKLGSRDEKRHALVYGLNCGYAQEVLEEENRWQDVCVLGVKRPAEWFEGIVRARLFFPTGEVWAVAPREENPTLEEIRRETAFLGEPERIST